MKYFSCLVIFFALIFSLNAQGQDPIFTTNPIVTVNQGQEYFYPIQAVDPEGGAISYSASLPSWLSLGSSENAVVTTFAGSVTSGFQEGTGANASFRVITGIAVDMDGNIFVADRFNHRIRKITPEGVVSTFVGVGRAGFKDGNRSEAILNEPSDLVFDADGNIIFIDNGNYSVRKISKDGQVSTIAGSGLPGYKDATGHEAQFDSLLGIAIDSDGNLYLTDNGNKAIRKVTPEFVVSTIASSLDIRIPTSLDFQSIHGIALDDSKNIYVGDGLARNIKRIAPSGSITVFAGSGDRKSTDGQGVSASFSSVYQIAFDTEGNLLVADGNAVRVISPEANVTTLNIGEDRESLGSFNVIDVALDNDDNILTASTFNILKASKNGTTTLVAGGAQVPYVEDLKSNSTFSVLQSVAVKNDGTVYFTESGSGTIRKISIDGSVTTVAGSGQIGSQDGRGSEAKFSTILNLTVDQNGWVYISDRGNNVIKRMDDNGLVTTFAGSGTDLIADGQGTSASFQEPGNITTDLEGNVYVVDQRTIRKITPFGVVSTLAGSEAFGFLDGIGSQAKFASLSGIDADASGNVFVIDQGNFRVRKITPAGQVSTIAGSGISKSEDGSGLNASFFGLQSIAITNSGKIYISDVSQLRVIDEQLNVSTIAGKVISGSIDGVGSDALFSDVLVDLDLDKDGNLLVADYTNRLIRKVLFSSPVLKGNAGNNVGIHNVSITATNDNGDETVQSFQIEVEVIDTEDPLLTSATTANFAENGTGTAYTITATDASPLAYSLGTENDEALFNVDATTGVVTFKSVPDFETKNSYTIQVRASDGLNTAAQNVTITVTNVNEAPTFNSTPVTNLNEGGFYSYAIRTADADNHAVTVTATTKPNWLSLTTSAGGDVTTLAGSGAYGNTDANGASASFNNPSGVAVDGSGNVYVADHSNHKIRKVAPDGEVTTLAGSGATGSTDANSASASFNGPDGVAVDGSGNIYVADFNNHKIRKISPNGDVTTLAGSGTGGSTDANGTSASFYGPKGVAVDGSGNVYVADQRNNKIRKIAPNGDVTTLAGSGAEGLTDANGTSASFNAPLGVAVDGSGNVYVADYNNVRIRKISPNGDVTTLAGSDAEGSTDANGTSASFNFPTGVAVDGFGNVYVADYFNHKIRKIAPNGDVTTLAGSGAQGSNDANGTSASFIGPTGVAVDGSGNVYVADYFNHKIRKISASGAVLSGTAPAVLGDYPVVLSANDGNGGTANQSFTITITDTTNPVFTSATVVNFAENGTGTAYTIIATDANAITYSLGTGNDEALFNVDATTGEVTFKVSPDFLTKNSYTIQVKANDGLNTATQNVTITVANLNEAPTFTSTPVTNLNEGGFYSYAIRTADADNHSVTVTATTKPNWLSLTTTAGGDVTTLAGSGTPGRSDANGASASFLSPLGVAVDGSGNVYVVEGSYKIRKIAPNGDVTTLAGSEAQGGTDANGSSASFNVLSGVAVDGSGNVYVADQRNYKIRKIAPNGDVTTLAGSGAYGSTDANGTSASFSLTTGVAVDGSGNVYVADYFNHKIRKIASNGDVTTLAGSGAQGSTDANGISASFIDPSGVAVDGSGNVYVADQGNNKIRKIAPNGDVTTLAGSGSAGSTDANGTSASFNHPTGVAVDGFGDVYVADQRNNKIRKIAPNGDVTTLAGSGALGSTDAISSSASFNSPSGVAVDGSGHVYVADKGNNKIRKTSTATVLSGTAPTALGDYPVVLSANDGNGGTANQSFTITITDATNPVFTSSTTANFAENGTGTAYIITATDASLLTYSLGTENDEALFNVDAATGEVTFKVSPDFETPADANTDNDYVIEVKASDGNNTSSQSVFITITNVNESPVFTSSPVTNVDDDADYFYAITASDVDLNDLVLSATSIPDWLSLKNTPKYNVVTLAGSGVRGTSDEIGLLAEFSYPVGVVVDLANNLYVADQGFDLIRKISPLGEVSTIAGTGAAGFGNANGTLAVFDGPTDLAIDSNDNLYVADIFNHRIRKITPDGLVSTFAGSTRGFSDGTSVAAKFNSPSGLTIDQAGNLYVCDSGNNRIRKITPDGIVSTIAGSGNSSFVDGVGTSASFSNPADITFDNSGNLYVSDLLNHRIRKIAPSGMVTTVAGSISGFSDGIGTSAKFNRPRGLAIDEHDNLYVADEDNNRIRKISPSGMVTTIAGNENFIWSDGIGTNAQFNGPTGLALSQGILYVTDAFNHRVRFLNLYEFSELSGSAIGQTGDHQVVLSVIDGKGGSSTQSFSLKVNDVTDPVFTSSLAVDFAENGTGTAYTITAADTNPLTYSLGTENDEAIFNVDATTGEVTFKVSPDFETPADANTDNDYVIKVIASDGQNIVEQTVTITVTNVIDENPVFTSSPITEVDDKSFYSYTARATSKTYFPLNLKVLDFPDWLSIETSYKVSTLAGRLSISFKNGDKQTATFNHPSGMVFDSNGNLFIADRENNVIRKIDIDGSVITFAGSGYADFKDGNSKEAAFHSPHYLAIDNENNLYVSDLLNHAIRKVTKAGEVTTIAGNGNLGYKDGIGFDSQLAFPYGIAIDSEGNIFISDSQNNRIRKINTEGYLSTFVGSGSYETINANGVNASFTSPTALAIDANDNLYVAEGEYVIRKVNRNADVTTIVGNGLGGYKDGIGTDAQLYLVTDMTFDNSGNLLFNDGFNSTVRQMTPEGVVTTIAGTGEHGESFGPAISSSLMVPLGIVVDQSDNIFIAELFKIKVINSEGLLEAYATGGTTYPIDIYDGDGIGSDASFEFVSKVSNDSKGNLFVTGDGGIRKITPQGVVSTITTFNIGTSWDVFVDSNDEIFFTDLLTNQIKKMTLNGQVSIVAGTGTEGSLDGISSMAEFKSPRGIVKDNNENLFVTDSENHRIRQISPNGEVTTFGGSTQGFQDGTLEEAKFDYPNAIELGKEGDLFVVDKGNKLIRKVSAEGQVSTFAGDRNLNSFSKENVLLTFISPSDLAFDDLGNLWVADAHLLKRVNTQGVIDLVIGTYDLKGNMDGDLEDATFEQIEGISYHNGILYLTDVGNHTVRQVHVDELTLSGFTEKNVGIYNVALEASDIFGNSRKQEFVLTVEDATAPAVEAINPISYVENTSNIVVDVDATDTNPNAEIQYKLGYGNDEALFNIAELTGVISFKSPPDFENPLDKGKINIYQLEVEISDGINVTTQRISVTVTDVDDTPPVITSATVLNFTENGTGTAYTIIATDENTITYSLGTENDEDFFDLDAGVVTFKTAPDFETKSSYVIEVKADDGLNTASQTVTITITDVDEIDPVFTSATAVDFAENGTGTAYTITATDENTITYSLGTGNDESLFDLDEGVVTFKIAPDFETKSSYVIEVKANDGLNTASQTVTITITDVDEIDPVFTSATAVNFAENGTGAVYTIIATDENTITYSLGTDNDESLFDLDAGVVTFKIAPDFETKSSYVIEVKADDGLNEATQTVNITVTNVNEAPTGLLLSEATIEENNSEGAEIGQFTTTDPDAADTHSYVLATGDGDADNASFEIVGDKLVSKVIFDFEVKRNYSVRVKTLDAIGLPYEETFVIEITNQAEAILRLEGGESPEITDVGETSNINLVIHNDGDGVLNITAITYPSGFSGKASASGIEPGASQSIDVTFTPTEAKTYSGDIVFTYNGGTTTTSISAEAQLVTSIDEGFIAAEEVTIFPNPAMNEVTINLTAYNYREVAVMIISESGVSMYEKTKIKTAKHTVNVSSYSQGAFIVLVRSEFGVIRKKLVISR
jgi:hypothetical protein